MIRKGLRKIHNWLNRRPARKPWTRNARLGIELLEGRDLLSAGGLTDLPAELWIHPEKQQVLTLANRDGSGNSISYQLDSVALDQQAYDLDQKLGLRLAKISTQNQLGADEKWLKDSNGHSYYLLPDGELWRWHHSAFGQAGQNPDTLVATLDSSYYNDPTTLASAPQPELGVYLKNGQLKVRTSANASGDFTVGVTRTDGPLQMDEALTVHVGDRAPMLDAIADQLVKHDTKLVMTLSASDADGDKLKYSASITDPAASGKMPMSVNASGNKLTIKTSKGYVGQFTVQVTVSDGIETATQSFSVEYFDNAPTLDPIANQEVKHDSKLVIPLSASDADGDKLRYSARVIDPAPTRKMPMSVNVSGNTLTIKTNKGYVGQFTVQVTASDGIASAVQTFMVDYYNYDPALDVTNLGIATGQKGTLTLPKTDAEGDKIKYTARLTDPAARAYDLRNQLGLSSVNANRTNKLGANEEWLQGNNGKWYFITPDGSLYKWNGQQGTPDQAGVYIDTLDSSFWSDPTLLYKAAKPSVTVDFSGSRLTVKRAAGTTDTHTVTLTASDGLATTTDIITVDAGPSAADPTQQISVGPDGLQYALGNDGRFRQLISSGLWHDLAANGVSQLADGNDQHRYYLQGAELWEAVPASPWRVDIQDNVLAMVQSSGGEFWLNRGTDGLQLYDPATTVRTNYGVVRGFAEGDDGNLYYLQKGQLWRGLADSASEQSIQKHVNAIERDANGQIWLTRGGDDLQLLNPATSGSTDYGTVQGLAAGSDGHVYYLQNQQLMDGTTGGMASPNVVAMGGTPNGQVYFQKSDRGLYQVGGNGQPLTIGVATFAVAGDGQVFVLTTSGILEYRGPDGAFHQVAFDLSLFTSLATRADGTVDAIDTGPTLYRYKPYVGWSEISSGVPHNVPPNGVFSTAYLVDAYIHFTTGNDDKDHDTLVYVNVWDSHRVKCVSFGGLGYSFDQRYHFVENTDNGIFDLGVANASYADFRQPWQSQISIWPNGDDTWNFKYTLTLAFSDGSTLSWSQGYQTLTTDNPALTPLHLYATYPGPAGSAPGTPGPVPSDGQSTQANGLKLPFAANISVTDGEGDTVELAGSSATAVTVTDDGNGGYKLAIGISLQQDTLLLPDGSLFPYDMSAFYSCSGVHVESNGHVTFTLTSTKNVQIAGDGYIDSDGFSGSLHLTGSVPGIGTKLEGWETF